MWSINERSKKTQHGLATLWESTNNDGQTVYFVTGNHHSGSPYQPNANAERCPTNKREAWKQWRTDAAELAKMAEYENA